MSTPAATKAISVFVQFAAGTSCRLRSRFAQLQSAVLAEEVFIGHFSDAGGAQHGTEVLSFSYTSLKPNGLDQRTRPRQIGQVNELDSLLAVDQACQGAV